MFNYKTAVKTWFSFMSACIVGWLYAQLMLLMNIRSSPFLSTEFITFVVLVIGAGGVGWIIGKRVTEA